MASQYALDASALLAWLNGEAGGEKVEPLLEGSVISAVNLSEVLHKGLAAGADVSGLKEDLEALGVGIVDFTAEDAEISASLWPQTRSLGLSLADRCCLATATRLGVTAVTADLEWTEIEGATPKVQTIR